MQLSFDPLYRDMETRTLYVLIEIQRYEEPKLTFIRNTRHVYLQTPLYSHLSWRELEVLFWAMMGETNTKIAERLYIVESTVEAHFQKIYSKLGVRNRTPAATAAWLNHLIKVHIVENMDS